MTTTPFGGTATTTTFTYGNTTHPDRLTAFNGKPISYNSMGCVTNYDGKNYTWRRGKLGGFTRGSSTQPGTLYESFTANYDALGRRVSKNYVYDPNPASTSDYSYSFNTQYTYDNNGRLIRENCTERYVSGSEPTWELAYLYDESGIVGCVHTVNNTTTNVYYYRRNLQGDVVGIYNANGELVTEYAYDAYGNCTIKQGAGNTISKINPIRYRGYYFDRETNLYYLNSRYYNPEWRRFLSPDDSSYLNPENVNGLNLYCYCNNDPINFVDPSGHFMISTAVAVGFWIGLAVGAIAGATAGGIIAHNIAEDQGAEGWELFAWTMLGIVGGGAIGGAAGAALGSSIGYGVGLLWGTAPAAGSQGAVALWSGGLAEKAAADFAARTGAKLLGNTLAGKTLEFASVFMPKSLSGYLWAKLSVEFVTGASSATIFLLDAGIRYESVFFKHEIWVLLEKGIERVIYFV